MREFDENRPIYKQIIDYCFEQIIAGVWSPGERIPSIRELAVEMTVNTRTVVKAMESLQAAEIIYPQRGMGYYLYPDAKEKVYTMRRREFFSEKLPVIFHEMHLLGITLDDIIAHTRNTPPTPVTPNHPY